MSSETMDEDVARQAAKAVFQEIGGMILKTIALIFSSILGFLIIASSFNQNIIFMIIGIIVGVTMIVESVHRILRTYDVDYTQWFRSATDG